jgi:Mg/Co/Ni transporter MgtE
MSDWRRLLEQRAYAEIRRKLAAAGTPELAAAWAELTPLQRLTLFKLLDAARALEFYEALPFADRYFLLGGFPLQAIAPVLEDLEPSARRLFVQLPRGSWERMFRGLDARKVS